MATKTEPDALTVTESFIGSLNGKDEAFRAGDTVSPGHPAVKKWPQFFKVVRYQHDHVEQATAAPGEQRA